MINGTLLRQLRKEHNLSAEKLGKEMNTSTSTVYRWENDNSLYDIDIIMRLAKFYNVSVSYLLNEENENEVAATCQNQKNASTKKRTAPWLKCVYIVAKTIMIFLIVTLLIVFFTHTSPTTGDGGYDLLIFVCVTFVCFIFTIMIKILTFYHLNKRRK